MLMNVKHRLQINNFLRIDKHPCKIERNGQTVATYGNVHQTPVARRIVCTEILGYLYRSLTDTLSYFSLAMTTLHYIHIYAENIFCWYRMACQNCNLIE